MKLTIQIVITLVVFMGLAYVLDSVPAAFILGMVWSAVSKEIRRKHK